MQDEQLAQRLGGAVLGFIGLLLLLIGVITWQVLRGLQQPTQDQVVTMTPYSPQDYKIGPRPDGGPSEAPTAAGAGGSAAAGYETGRVGASLEEPIKPPQPYGLTYSRMSPVGSDGSASADRSTALPPNQPLVAGNADGVTQPISAAAPPQMPVNVRQ